MTVRTNALISERTLAALVTSTNAFFATKLNHIVEQFDYRVVDDDASRGQEYTIAIQVEDSGVTMTNPFLVQQFGGRNPVESMASFIAYVAANPTLFISEPDYWPFLTERRRTNLWPILACSNVDAANGALNWAGGGGPAPIGPAGGDLSGTYPNPKVFVGQLSASPGAGIATTLDTVTIAAFKTVVWELQAVKGVNTYSSRLSASHDGTTAVFVTSDSALAPGGGTFDFVKDVSITGANMNLVVTPATGGWTFRCRRISELAS